MLIVNKTDLKLFHIVMIITMLIKTRRNETIYYGKKDVVIVKAYKKVLKVEIIYLKRYTKWVISEKVVNKNRNRDKQYTKSAV